MHWYGAKTAVPIIRRSTLCLCKDYSFLNNDLDGIQIEFSQLGNQLQTE